MAVVAGSLLVNGPGLFAAGSRNLEGLLALAHEKALHKKRYWHILLHYEDKFTGVVSQIDDPDFFLAAGGKSDPEAELDATIRYLFGGGKDEQERICRFYARFRWLQKKLAEVLPACLAERRCPAIDRIKPRSASLVFPTYYLNNPASMFGHTLITIDTAYTNKRLSNAVNYAASTEGRNGIGLAVSGLTGLYRGYYSVMPYYKKIQEYSDINQRDIWEYRLNLTRPELRRMVWHIREMDQIYSDYYFFDENCSYNLLYLLEAARPSAHLVDRFHVAAIPVDTIKAVREAGFIEGADFRPAKTTRIAHLEEQLPEEQLDTVGRLLDGRISAGDLLDLQLARERKIRMLDLAVEVIQYRYVNKELDKKAYRGQLMAALRARSQLGRLDKDRQDDIPVPPRPDSGHESKRASLGFGMQSGDAFYELRLRPALTDLTDTDYIHNQGAQIEFFDLRTRYYPESRRFALEQCDLVDIVSIVPVSAFSRPISWKFNTGWQRKPLETEDDASYYRVDGGAGFSGEIFPAGLCYAMAEAELDIGGDLAADYALGAGTSVGTIVSAGDACRIHLYGRIMRFFCGGPHTAYTAGAAGNFRVSTNNHISLAARHEDAGSRSWEVSAVWHWFF